MEALRCSRVRTSLAWLSLLATAFIAACSDDDGGGSSSTTTTTTSGEGGAGGGDRVVELRFEGRIGDQLFSCGSTYAGLGTSEAEASLTDFRLYLHDLQLHRIGGGEVPLALAQDGLWQHQDLVLLDFEDGTGGCANGTEEMNVVVRGTVPAGDYDGLSSKLGVPFELNHADVAAAPSPLNLSALYWSWNGGYKFLRADAVPTGGADAFNLHLGSTGCTDDPGGRLASCDRPNVAEIVLPSFNPRTSKVLIDYGAVIAGSDLTVNVGGAPGCMSGAADPECAAVFERLGIDVVDGSIHPKQQALFRAE